MMLYRFFLIPLLLVLLGCHEPKNVKPNILLILADDQGWGDLSVNGNPYLNTPNIDSLGYRGARFSRFYVMPVCSPTRAEILTGRHHVRSNVFDTSAGGERLDLDEMLMPELFKAAGYRTGAFGKWHNGRQPPYHPNSRGFEEFFGFCAGHWGNYFSPVLEHNGELVKGNGYLADDLTDHAIQFIESPDERPFFTYLALNTPHSPMQVPDKWWEEYSGKALDIPHRYSGQEDKPHTRAAYAMVENIDYNVGKLVDFLQSRGLLENTIVVYLSDNGPNGWRWNDGLKGRKGQTDEGGVRSPLHIQWKGKIAEETVIDIPAGAIDLLPTLLDLTGIQERPVKPMDGISLAPILTGEPMEDQGRYIFSYWNEKISLRNEQYMLDAGDKLYDLLADAGQETDISSQNPEIYRSMLSAKESWKKEVLSELDDQAERPFPITGDFPVHLPAGDGMPHGNIVRSNRWPNDSWFTGWKDSTDFISWRVDVLTPGIYEAILHYSCKPENTGLSVVLNFGEERTGAQITIPNDPPEIGAENDRVPREESYVKDFRPVSIGQIYLPQGRGDLILSARDIRGNEAIEMNLLILRKVSP